MKLPTIDFLTDRLAMYAAVLVGIATTSYLSVSITPDLWSKIVMGIFGGGLPLISVRFLIKKKVRFFWMTVCLIVFCDVSMVLSLTASQAHDAKVQASGDDQTPAPLKRLQNATDDTQKGLDELLVQQKEAQTKAFLENLKEQIRTATASRDAAQAREAAWVPVAKADEIKVSSADVFMAIPAALFSLNLSRYMTLVFALLVAIVYQGTVIATVNATVKQVRRDEAKPPKTRKRTRAAKKPAAAPSREDFQPEEKLPTAGGMTEVL